MGQLADHPDAHFRERDTYGRLIVIADTFPAYSLIRNKAWNARVSASMIAMWRLAKAADDDLLVEMCFQLYAEDPGPLPVQAGNMRETLEALRRDPCRGRALVLEIQKKQLSGYALLIASGRMNLAAIFARSMSSLSCPNTEARALGSHSSRLLRKATCGPHR